MPLPYAEFTQLIGSMFLTEPPCKELGVYVPSIAGNRRLDRVCGVQDEGGIRINHLLSTIQEHSKDVIELWKKLAEDLKSMISEPPWILHTLAGEKLRHWLYPGMPTFVIVLESGEEDREKTLAKCCYGLGEDFKRMCESQWYEDMSLES
jgi:hypothetical protein